jgi:CRP-like cAMP-binding protein
VVQLSGEAFRIEQKRMVDALARSASLSNLVLRYQTALLIQVSYTALSHGGFTVPERLARWLLMVQDRAEGDEFPLVHEFFSWMLAVRRAGVTEAFRDLRSHGCIETGRGMVKILDREMLIELSSGSYGPPEIEYERLLGKASA